MTPGQLIEARADEVSRFKREPLGIECRAHGETADWHLLSVVELAEIAAALSEGVPIEESRCLDNVLRYCRRARNGLLDPREANRTRLFGPLRPGEAPVFDAGIGGPYPSLDLAQAIVDAPEPGGKQPHSVKPGGYQPIAKDIPVSHRVVDDFPWPC